MTRTDYEQGQCPAEANGLGKLCGRAALGLPCFTDTHHEVWPRKKYRTKIEKSLRELACYKTVLCRGFHDELHAITPPPKKPSRDEMINIVKEEKDARTEV